MSTLPLVTVRPSAAAQAYQTVQGGALESGGGDFGSVLRDAVSGAIASGHAADALAAQTIAGNGNVTELVTAVSKAELALQTTAAIRDRVVQAYQDIMRMPI